MDAVRGVLDEKYDRIQWSGCKESSQDKLPPKPRKKHMSDVEDSSRYMPSRDAP